MQCEQTEALLVAYLLDELDTLQRAAVQGHVEHCSACHEKLGDLRATASILREALESEPAPVLDAAHLAALDAAITGKPLPRHSPATPAVLLRRAPYLRLRLSAWYQTKSTTRIAAAAAVLGLSAVLVGLMLPSLGSARRTARQMQSNTQARGIQQGMAGFDYEANTPVAVPPAESMTRNDSGSMPGDSRHDDAAGLAFQRSFDRTRITEELTPTDRITGQVGGSGAGGKAGEGTETEAPVTQLAQLNSQSRFEQMYPGIDGSKPSGERAAADEAAQRAVTDVTALTASQQQLAQLKETLQEEIKGLSNEHSNLREGAAKYQNRATLTDDAATLENRHRESEVTNLNSADRKTTEAIKQIPFVSDLTPIPDSAGFDPIVVPATPPPTETALAFEAGRDQADTDKSKKPGASVNGPQPVTRVYDTRDMQQQHSNFSEAPEFDLNTALSNTKSEGSGASAATSDAAKAGPSLFSTASDEEAEESARERKIQELTQAIQAQVGQPQEWTDNGGEESDIKQFNGNLIVKTTPANQQKIDDLIRDLRETDQARKGKAVDRLEMQQAQLQDGGPPVTRVYDIRDLLEGEKADASGKREELKQSITKLEKVHQLAVATQLADGRERARQLNQKVENTAATIPYSDEPAPAPRFVAGPVNPWVMTAADKLSTFALDVDTASYSIARSYIAQGYRPPPASVRMEEYVNAFDYNYDRQSQDVFAVHVEGAPSPFAAANENLTTLKIGVQARVVGREGRKPAHLIFVIDTSGSMARADRLPMIQRALSMMIEKLGPADRVSVVTFGARSTLLLQVSPASDKKRFIDTLDAIRCQGSTNLLEGLELGYQVAEGAFHAGAINRVILCSDGVANIGATQAQQMLDRVSRQRQQGITFTAVGVGAGSYNDELLQQLADKGDGNYYFIDSDAQAKHVLVDNLSATIHTVARDARIQVEFDPAKVRRYRLIGYEKRAIADKDFRNDAIDAGEVGSGQSATAVYELELVPRDEAADDIGAVFVRYRDADTGQVQEISRRISRSLIQPRTPEEAPRFYLAAAAAQFGESLRHSEHARNRNLAPVQSALERVCMQIPLDNQARELLVLVRRAQGLPEAPTNPK